MKRNPKIQRPPIEVDAIYSRSDAAAITNTSVPTIDRALASGALRRSTRTRRALIRGADLLNWLFPDEGGDGNAITNARR